MIQEAWAAQRGGLEDLQLGSKERRPGTLDPHAPFSMSQAGCLLATRHPGRHGGVPLRIHTPDSFHPASVETRTRPGFV